MEKIAPAPERLESVDLVLAMIEFLAGSPGTRSLGEIARVLQISKPRAHRHLRALMLADYVRQDAESERYEISTKLVVLGEAVRARLSFGTAARQVMTALRDATDQAVTASTLVGGQVTIVELVHGRTLVQFAIRPGTVMDPARSAHGLIARAFGDPTFALPADILPEASRSAVAAARRLGWATAPEQIVTGVNALAAPVFGHDGAWAGTIAIVGSIDAIPARPERHLIDQVVDAARDVSTRLGWVQA